MKLPPVRRSRFASLFDAGILLFAVWGTGAVIVVLQLLLYHHYDWRLVLPLTFFNSIPFIVASPLIIWFANVVQIDARSWKWTLPAHIAFCLLLNFSLDYGLERAVTHGLISAPRPGMVLRNSVPENRRLPAETNPAVRDEVRRDLEQARRAAWRKAYPNAVEPPVIRQGFGPGGPGRFFRTRFLIPIYFALVAVTHAYTYQRRDRERRENALLVQAQLDEARLRALQMQLQPHFLFNTLNAISSLIATHPQAAESMVHALSELLRDVLATTDQPRIPLAVELDTLDRYLAIQLLRFPDRLTIERDIEPDLEDVGVPPLLLQPIVENTFQHGLSRRPGPCLLTVSIRRIDEQLRIAITDRRAPQSGATPDPAPARPQLGPGLGLVNTRDRLAALYGDRAHLEAKPIENGFQTELFLPCQPLTADS